MFGFVSRQKLARGEMALREALSKRDVALGERNEALRRRNIALGERNEFVRQRDQLLSKLEVLKRAADKLKARPSPPAPPV
jgi:hypothetical protein